MLRWTNAGDLAPFCSLANRGDAADDPTLRSLTWPKALAGPSASEEVDCALVPFASLLAAEMPPAAGMAHPLTQPQSCPDRPPLAFSPPSVAVAPPSIILRLLSRPKCRRAARPRAAPPAPATCCRSSSDVLTQIGLPPVAAALPDDGAPRVVLDRAGTSRAAAPMGGSPLPPPPGRGRMRPAPTLVPPPPPPREARNRPPVVASEAVRGVAAVAPPPPPC